MFFWYFFVFSSTLIEKLEIEERKLDTIKKDLDILTNKQKEIVSSCESLFINENFLKLKMTQLELQGSIKLLRKSDENLDIILSEASETNDNIMSTEEKPKFISEKMYSFIRTTYLKF